jgi:hypothetical protein
MAVAGAEVTLVVAVVVISVAAEVTLVVAEVLILAVLAVPMPGLFALHLQVVHIHQRQEVITLAEVMQDAR